MRIRCSVLVFGCAVFFTAGCNTFQASPAPAQTAAPMNTSTSLDSRQVELANMRADLQAMDRRVRELNGLVEDLTRQNREMASQIERLQRAQPGDTVRQVELAKAVQELQQRTDAASAEQRRQIISQVSRQIDDLGKQTQAAIDALARSINARPAAASGQTSRPDPAFSDDFPKEGISYTVQRGDTLSGIAARQNSTVRDIQNANRISNPAAIQVGQVLFIPQRN